MKKLLTICLFGLIGSVCGEGLQIENKFIFGKEIKEDQILLAGCPCKNRGRRGKPQPPKEGEKTVEQETKERNERKV